MTIPADAFIGCIIGDAIGLPREAMTPDRALRRFGGSPMRHAFAFGRGMMSDDTEHACMTAQALLATAQNGNVDTNAFARNLARRLRWWFAGLPAGTGLATARAILRLWVAIPPSRSGVASAGNGPAMRSAIIGLSIPHEHLEKAVRASSQITHTDPRAHEGALVIALAARIGAELGPDRASHAVIDRLLSRVEGLELRQHLECARKFLAEYRSVKEFAIELSLGKGVTGYINHTVPVAIYCWLAHPRDFRAAVESAILLGGDTDTVGAIVGALAGATLRESGLPREWVDGLWEWPRSIAWMKRLALRLHENTAASPPASPTRVSGPVALFWPAIPFRNLLFLVIVLAHGFRRLTPW